MSDNKLSEIKPFKQVPSCEPDTLLTITAAEFDTIQSVLAMFKNPIAALDSVFNRGLNEGKIVTKYIQEDGTEITEEEATKYLELAKEFLNKKEEPTEMKAV